MYKLPLLLSTLLVGIIACQKVLRVMNQSYQSRIPLIKAGEYARLNP